MNHKFRLVVVLATVGLVAASTSAVGQKSAEVVYPSRPVRLIVP